jgi:hypothetical protein
MMPLPSSPTRSIFATYYFVGNRPNSIDNPGFQVILEWHSGIFHGLLS